MSFEKQVKDFFCSEFTPQWAKNALADLLNEERNEHPAPIAAVLCSFAEIFEAKYPDFRKRVCKLLEAGEKKEAA